MPKAAIGTYKIFISHSYRVRLQKDYARLVQLLDQYADRDASWRWENVSIPRDAPVLKKGHARFNWEYLAAMRPRIAQANAILLILRPAATTSSYVFDEDYVTTPRRRLNPPVINVLPPDQDRKELAAHWGTSVPWDAGRIVKAIRRLATAANPDELELTPDEAGERARIVAALDARGWRMGDAAKTLGVGRNTLWRKMRLYVIYGPTKEAL
jgi:hypothetical protein